MGIVSEVTEVASMLVKATKFMNQHSGAITKYANTANILGRVYVEEAVTQDDILLPIMSSLCSMYVGWILTALNLNSQVIGGGTVRDKLSAVAGESLKDANVVGDILDKFDGKFRIVPSNEAGTFDVDKQTDRFTVGKVIELEFATLDLGQVRVGDMNGQTVTRTTVNNDVSTQRTSSTNHSTTQKATPIKVFITIRLHPEFLTTDVCKNFMSLNFVPSISRRWNQYRAGEISFWKDFIFARDLVKRHAQLLKNDRTGIVAELALKNKNKLFKWLLGMAAQAEQHNLANSMLIFNKPTFDQTCRDAGVDFNSFSSRQKFFGRTWSIVVVVVDQLYGRVTMYFNGIDTPATYTYAMINKVGAKGRDQFDLKDIMTAFGSGQSPKF